MSDLLPPSPSAASPVHRYFAPSPSTLSVNTVPNESVSPHHLAPASGIQFPSQSPSIMISTSPTAKSVTVDSPSSMSPRWGNGPPIRPLDYCQLLSSQDLHAELQRTVDDLAQWLALVDQGLSAMLDTSQPDDADFE